ncbi:allergen Tha p 1-like [Leptidea sinapis]|uniref:Uncharacterized protein n=1 Tax=Leptidea sinapis TaxID=189913 RepID=A0A5E4QHP3_9NEOP|nr:allergen Tha p 1-like [Leptidea sinapis]VVC97645.1 unnamed protein product [Leptidea sinapis]
MKLVLLLCLFALAYGQDKYDLEDFNIEEVINNDRLILSYSKCFINKGPCTPEIKRIKDKIPEILETHCAKCTDKQKEIGKILFNKLKTDHPAAFKELAAFYDPTGKYQESFKDILN